MRKARLLLLFLLGIVFTSHVQSQTTIINGLAVVVDFTDYKLSEQADTLIVDDMMNQSSEFTTWNNNGSVKEYFLNQSNGKLQVNTHVVQVQVNNSFAYYWGENEKRQDFIIDVVNAIKEKYPNGFNDLSANQGRLWHFNTLFTGYAEKGFITDLNSAMYIKNSINGNPDSIKVGNVVVAGYESPNKPEINVICHEMGHSLFNWKDYYYPNQLSTTNIGHYCLMGSGGISGSPMPISAPLRYEQGWIDSIITIDNTSTQTYTARSNDVNQVFKYNNPSNSKEYILIESYQHKDYYLPVVKGYNVDEGLALWYVYEGNGIDGSNDERPNIKLIQADGMDEMNDATKTHRDHRGDETDLFDNIYNSFSNESHAIFTWNNGDVINLHITDITKPDSTVDFKVNAIENIITATAGANGKISLSGKVNVPTGQNKTFEFIPNFGYQINNVTVDGVPQGAITSYTFNNVTTDHSISVTFSEILSGYDIPSPWIATDVGYAPISGQSKYNNGQFELVSYGNDIYTYDNFHFVYQTLTGDGELIARIAESNAPKDWSKSGLMIRESLTSQSKYVMISSTPDHGIDTQFRLVDMQGSGHENNSNEFPVWFKIRREGNVITTSYSPDAIHWIDHVSKTLTLQPTLYFGLYVTGSVNNIPIRTLFDNVSLSSSISSFSCSNLLTGTAFGTSPAFQYGTATFDKAFDGNTGTYFDYISRDGGYTGLDFGSAKKINGIKFYPRNGNEGRMVQGVFQASNDSNFTTGVVDLYTILSAPSLSWNIVPINDTAGYRYFRYLSPNSGYCNVAEIQVCGSSNQAPAVSITGPANNAIYNVATTATITINASASDSDGTITNVEFYNGAQKIGEDDTAPYSFTWSNVAAGSYQLTAKAYDNSDNVTTSSVVNVSVAVCGGGSTCANVPAWNSSNAYSKDDSVTYNSNLYRARWWTQGDNPANSGQWGVWEDLGSCSSGGSCNDTPEVSITSPANNATFTEGDSITITANATDSDGSITKVEFYRGATKIGEATSSPYSVIWNNATVGNYTLTAVATDNDNDTTTSAGINITVNSASQNTPPSVSITSPSDNATFDEGDTITFTATANDTDGTVTKVEFYRDATKIGEATSSPYSVIWNNATVGNYTIKAIATDNDNDTTTSSPISITVEELSTGGCSGIAQYQENGGYIAGSRVQNNNVEYECKPWPASGWCNGAAWAYEPGNGTYWTDAWTEIGSCNARKGTFDASEIHVTLSPNPTNGVSLLNIDSDQEVTLITVTNSHGEEVFTTSDSAELTINLSNEPQGLYLLRVHTNHGIKIVKLVKE